MQLFQVDTINDLNSSNLQCTAESLTAITKIRHLQRLLQAFMGFCIILSHVQGHIESKGRMDFIWIAFISI